MQTPISGCFECLTSMGTRQTTCTFWPAASWLSRAGASAPRPPAEPPGSDLQQRNQLFQTLGVTGEGLSWQQLCVQLRLEAGCITDKQGFLDRIMSKQCCIMAAM